MTSELEIFPRTGFKVVSFNIVLYNTDGAECVTTVTATSRKLQTVAFGSGLQNMFVIKKRQTLFLQGGPFSFKAGIQGTASNKYKC